MDVLLMGLLTFMQPTATVKNPTVIEIASCPDHDQDTGHQIDIIRTDGTVLQTLDGGDPPADASGKVTFKVNVQPVQFGIYTVIVRATAAGATGINSPVSDPWERAPGPPSKPVVK